MNKARIFGTCVIGEPWFTGSRDLCEPFGSTKSGSQIH